MIKYDEQDFPIQAKDLFKGLWENELLTETHLQDLYHATNDSQLLSILQDGAIKLTFVGGTHSDTVYNRGYPFFLSTMRQKYGNFARDIGKESGYIKYGVVIHLDGEALKNAGYKMFPVEYWGWGSEYSEQEERIVSWKDEIRPLKRFIKDIHIHVPTDLKQNWTIDRLHKISQLAKDYALKVYFYRGEDKDWFKAHRHEKAVTDVSQILQPAEFTPEELGDHERLQQLLSRKRDTYIDAFLRFYKGDYSKIDSYPDKSLRQMMLFYPHDALPAISAAIHNDKRKHLPQFKELADIMKKEKVKTFVELFDLIMKRENERYERERRLKEYKELRRMLENTRCIRSG